MKKLNILICCEESQAFAKVFRKMGHNAFSADLQKCSGGFPQYHINGDCIPLINGNCEFITEDGKKHRIVGKWDLLVSHPPCTYLSSAGNRWFNVERYGKKAVDRIEKREDALKFFLKFVNADCEHIAVENPVGYVNTAYRKPDMILQPYHFGHEVSKATCFWTKGLSMVKPTNLVNPKKSETEKFYNPKGICFSDPRLKVLRSKTFDGLAIACAETWVRDI